jgi:hypothetical protein
MSFSSISQLAADPPSAQPAWLLRGLLARPGLNVFLGPLSSKKTWLALDLAVSVALGRGWLGLSGPPAPALFIDEESGPLSLWDRLPRVLAAHRAPPDTPFHFATGCRYDLADPRDTAALAQTARSLGAGLIIIDAPFNFRLDLDRNKLLSHHRALLNARHLAQDADAAMLILLHTKKRRTPLGSALASFGLDHVLAVDSPYGQPYIHLRTISSKGYDPISIKAEARKGSSTISPSSQLPVTPLGEAGFEILHYLARVGTSTTADLAAHCITATPTRIRTLIHELVCDGYLQRANPGGRGSVAAYQLTPAGRHLV